jgi:hypothetical protein
MLDLMRGFTCLAVVFFLTSCATDQTQWSMANAYFSPHARKLPRAELEEIVSLVTRRWNNVIVGVGQTCDDPPNVMHVVAQYFEDVVMVFDLKKEAGHWRITNAGEGTSFISTAWYSC